MNMRNLLLPAALAVLLGPTMNAATPATPGAGPNAQPAALAAGESSALQQGMPAAAVRQLRGQPDEIKAMNAPSGKAEVWVYKREVGSRMDRVLVSSADIVTNIIDGSGRPHQVSTPGPMRFHDVHRVTEEVTEVLMFNDHFVTQKVSRRERQTFD